MRVEDLERDMTSVVPTSQSRDSDFLFRNMTQSCLAACGELRSKRVLDVGSGFGQDAFALASKGASSFGTDPSGRMMNWARETYGSQVSWVQAWGEALPFADRTFDAVLCKGSLDHFKNPDAAIFEFARVVKCEGRVVVAVANFESLSCRIARLVDLIFPRGRYGIRRPFEVPSDHFTRYDPELLLGRLSLQLSIEDIGGVSLGWGLELYSRWLARRSARTSRIVLELADRLARRLPQLADVLVVTGKPRRSSIT